MGQFSKASRTMGCAASDCTIEGVFDRLDANGDGKIDGKDLEKHFGKKAFEPAVYEKCSIEQSYWCRLIKQGIDEKATNVARKLYNGKAGFEESPEKQASANEKTESLCRAFH